MATLIISDLEKKYGSNTVLKFNNFTLNEGISWLKGGNGTGKTTLFKILAGQTPFTGSVSLNNILLNKTPAAFRSLISYAEAEPQYPSFVTGKELINYYASIRKVSIQQSLHLAEKFEMIPFLDHTIESYSSGMLKKLSLICAFTGESLLYLLDEPLITIDTNATQVLYRQIQDLNKKGTIVMLSSHQEIDTAMISLSNTFIINNKQLSAC
ncbi:MAG: ABC transporter ATP-binding protein [Pedobacter sp.]|nr:MAG: ABC transporter ATP-binding protein [Pedobacter sp.]